MGRSGYSNHFLVYKKRFYFFNSKNFRARPPFWPPSKCKILEKTPSISKKSYFLSLYAPSPEVDAPSPGPSYRPPSTGNLPHPVEISQKWVLKGGQKVEFRKILEKTSRFSIKKSKKLKKRGSQNGQKWPKMAKIVKNQPKIVKNQPKMAKNRPKMAKNDQKWPKMSQNR